MIVLAIPILLICIILVIIILLLLRKWLISLVLFIVCLITNWYIEYFPINIISGEKYGDCLTIVTNNIYSQGEYLDSHRNNPDSLYVIFKRLDADVLVIQEYDSIRCIKLTEKLAADGYKIYQESHGLTYGENAIYSRIPLRNVRFEHDGLIMTTELFYNEHLICLFNCHLNSNNINEKIIYNGGNADWGKRLPDYIRSVLISSRKRKLEARHIRHKIDSCLEKNIPVIVAGDMNDIGGSRPIKIIEGRGKTLLRDAWWHSGNGVGSTYHGYDWLHFRLDHIFYSNHFNIINTNVRRQPFSDHNILVTKLKLK